MKKEISRDYTTEAFRLYAREGGALGDLTEAEAYDVEAVARTLNILHATERGDIVRAVREVYFANAFAPLRKGDISERVHRFALMEPASEVTVYRWLRKARGICALNRGLRV